MKVPKMIRTRQIEIAEELGYNADEVVADSFDSYGFVVMGLHKDVAGYPMFAPNEPIKTRIMWPNHDYEKRGLQARDDDFKESFARPSSAEKG